MSGVNLKDGTQIRKGASEAIKAYVQENNGVIPEDLDSIVTEISSLGGTPLVVCAGYVIYGVIYLKDTVKPGLVERFERLREIGIKTIMCTGDNKGSGGCRNRKTAFDYTRLFNNLQYCKRCSQIFCNYSCYVYSGNSADEHFKYYELVYTV